MASNTLSTSFSETSTDTAIIIPSKPALTVSYKQLTADIFNFQSKLAEIGIRHGDAISIALPNTYEFIVSFLATSYQRAIAAPLNPAYKQDEFEFYIDDLSSALALVPKGSYDKDGPAVRAARKYQAAIAECYLDGTKVVIDVKEKGKLADRKSEKVSQALPEDVALVLHTSGTTGRPKAVPLTHHNLTRTMRNVQETYELTPKDRTMLVMPLFHVHGLLAGFLGPLRSGGSVVVPGAFSAKAFWEDFVAHKANWYTAVPTIHQILLKNPLPKPLPEIRFIRSCSSPLSPKVFHELEKALKAPVLEAYAMTEASHQMTSNPLPHKGKRQPGSVGVGQGVEVKILDQEGKEVPQGAEAEICIRGENVTKGYLNNEKANKEAFTAGGFFRTGDQGKKDKDGYVIITGRIKELINRGGEKISPIELDNLIATHPKVGEAVSFAIPSELYGQEVGVAVVAKGGSSIKEQEIIDFVSERTAKFKKPTKVWILLEIPKTATGKIQRRKVADTLLEKDKKAKFTKKPEKKTVLFEICKKKGVFYLDLKDTKAINLIVQSEQIARLAEDIFNLPIEEKEKYLPRHGTLFGYKNAGRTITDRAGTRDTAEFFNVSKNDLISKCPSPPWPNLILDQKPLLKKFVISAHETALLILRVLNQKLSLPSDTLANLHRIREQSGDHIRMTRGPARFSGDKLEIQTPGHTDFGTVTVLFNWLGGLQIWEGSEVSRGKSGFLNVINPRDGDGEWRWVVPRPGHAIVNLGDAAVKFTNGLLCSGRHRVIPAPGEQGVYPRYSVVYFVRPEDRAVSKCLDSPGIIEETSVKEEEIMAKDWIAKQARGLAEAFKD